MQINTCEVTFYCILLYFDTSCVYFCIVYILVIFIQMFENFGVKYFGVPVMEWVDDVAVMVSGGISVPIFLIVWCQSASSLRSNGFHVRIKKCKIRLSLIENYVKEVHEAQNIIIQNDAGQLVDPVSALRVLGQPCCLTLSVDRSIGQEGRTLLEDILNRETTEFEKYAFTEVNFLIQV